MLTALIAYLFYRPKNKPAEIDPRLQSYVDDFIREANSRSIKVQDLLKGKRIVSSTTMQDRGLSIGKNVFVREDVIETANADHLRYLMFHELGHNLFGYPHSNDPQSIMAGGGVSADGKLKLSETERINIFFTTGK